MQYIEETKRRYTKFLEERYASVDDLNDKWGLGKRERLEEFTQARYPSRRRYEKAKDGEKAAIDAFWHRQDVEPEEADPEEGGEL